MHMNLVSQKETKFSSLRVINWNISYIGDIKAKIDCLKSLITEVLGDHPCIIALEEVTEKAYTELLKEDLFNNHAYSLNYRKPGVFEGRNRGLGCMVICVNGIEITNSLLLNRALFPERTLVANLRYDKSDFELICFHSITGVDYKKAKSAQFATLADFLNSRGNNPTILCCDLNEPEIDHIDLNQVRFFDQKGDKGKYASLILRPNGIHFLEDSYRVWLSNNTEEFNSIKKVQEASENLVSTPLTVSHILRGGIRKRYDYIMATPHWIVKKVDYRYDEAIRNGSDHAIVVTDFTKV